MQTIFYSNLFKFFLGISLLLIFVSVTPVIGANLYRKDPDIVGKIIDFESKKSIPGVVVMAMWSTEKFRLTIEPKSEYYDYFETLSGKDGEFRIPGKGLIVFRNVNPPKIKIFKAGYPFLSLDYYDNYLDKNFLELHPASHFVEWIDGTLIISIRKKSMEERKKLIQQHRETPFYGMGYVSAGKFSLYTEELRREYKAIGRMPPWEKNQLNLQYKLGGVYSAEEASEIPKKNE